MVLLGLNKNDKMKETEDEIRKGHGKKKAAYSSLILRIKPVLIPVRSPW